MDKLVRSWSSDTKLGDEDADEETSLLLPASQRELVFRANTSASFMGVGSDRTFADRRQGAQSHLEIARHSFVDFGSARRRGKSSSILDAMIKSETFDESSRRRYMVPPEYDEEVDPAERLAPTIGKAPSLVHIVEYRSGVLLVDSEVRGLDEYLNQRDSDRTCTWVHVEGPPEEALEVLGRRFGVHPLAQEDVCNTPQRPKLDQYDDMLFVVTHSPELIEQDHGGYEFGLNQVSIFSLYVPGVLVTFHEHTNETRGNWVQRVLDRIRNNTEDIRSRDISHLLYAVLDSVTDRYFPLLEFYGDRMEELESALVDKPDPELIKAITRLKRDLLLVRRVVWPMRECTSRLMVLSDEIVKKATKMYLRDLQDHLVQVVDILETYRDVSMSLLDLYLSATNNKMQEVMKTLTIISTIFIPLTFVTGVYGMNFEFMPELEWRFSYLAFWIFVIATVGLQLLYFHRLGWT